MRSNRERSLRTRQAQILANRMRRFLRRPIRLKVTNNRTHIVFIRRSQRGKRGNGRPISIPLAHVHHMFLSAPRKVLRALALYIEYGECDRKASWRLDDYIEARLKRIRTKGAIYDLQAIFDRLNERYFAGRVRALITWGRRSPQSSSRQSIKLGSYSVEDRLIRINPALDRSYVPRFFVEWIVYHEMLHQMYDIPTVNGRHRFHTPEFLAHERRFKRHEEARAWERRNLNLLLAS